MQSFVLFQLEIEAKMEFVFGWAIVFPIIVIIVALGISEFEFLPFVATLMMLTVLVNSLTLSVSSIFTGSDTHRASRSISVCDVSQDMGLVSGKSYPVEVGARIGGSGGSGYFYSGLFGGSGHINIQPASALSVGFDYKDKSAILEFPLRQMTFVKDEAATTPRMTINLRCESSVKGSQTYKLAPRHWVLDSGILYFDQKTTETGPYVVDSAVLANGLAPIVADNLANVEVRLSPELYLKILG